MWPLCKGVSTADAWKLELMGWLYCLHVEEEVSQIIEGYYFGGDLSMTIMSTSLVITMTYDYL